MTLSPLYTVCRSAHFWHGTANITLGFIYALGSQICREKQNQTLPSFALMKCSPSVLVLLAQLGLNSLSALWIQAKITLKFWTVGADICHLALGGWLQARSLQALLQFFFLKKKTTAPELEVGWQRNKQHFRLIFRGLPVSQQASVVSSNTVLLASHILNGTNAVNNLGFICRTSQACHSAMADQVDLCKGPLDYCCNLLLKQDLWSKEESGLHVNSVWGMAPNPALTSMLPISREC